MTTRHRRSAGAIACALLAVSGSSCSSCPGTSGDGGQASLEDLRKVYAAMCGVRARCPELAADSFGYRDTSECVDVLLFFGTCRLTETEDPAGESIYGVEQVLPGLSPAQAKTCAAWLRTASCEAMQVPCPADGGCGPCARLFASEEEAGSEPKAGLEERCDRLGCAEGLYCADGLRAPGDAGQACSVCKPLRGVGGDCVDPPFVACGPGLFCATDSGACAPLLPDGTSCAESKECASGFCNPSGKECDPGGHFGEPCEVRDDCREGFCETAASKCTALLANGSACTADEQCVALACDSASARCGKPDGARCSYPGDCQSGCCLSGVCIEGQAAGQPCATADECTTGNCRDGTCVKGCSGDSDCAADELCAHPGSYCRAKGEPSTACESDGQCLSGFCNQAGRCAVKPGLGGACSGSADCQPLGYCSDGVCRAFASPGGTCRADDACQAPYLCLSGACTRMDLICAPAAAGQVCAYLKVCDPTSYCDPSAHLCKPKKAPGSSCQRSAECPASQYCERGVCIAWGREGEACASKVCAVGLFCDASLAMPLCSRPKPDGASCLDGTNCQSGVCGRAGERFELVCGGAGCVMPPPGEVPACHPQTCAEAGLACGLLEDDGCGGWGWCGSCSGYQTCGGGGTPGVCGCTPRTCGPRDCGTIKDGCGLRLLCNEGSCPAGQACGYDGRQDLCGCRGDDEQGPRSASSGVTLAGSGVGPWEWVEAGSVAGEDGVGARVALHQDSFSGVVFGSEYLVAKDFGFALPPTASIYAIQVQIVRRASTPDDVEDFRVQLLSGGELVGDASGGSGERWSDTWTSVSYDNQLWGHGWTAEEVNSPKFGVALAVLGPVTNGYAEALVDVVRVKIVYAPECP